VFLFDFLLIGGSPLGFEIDLQEPCIILGLLGVECLENVSNEYLHWEYLVDRANKDEPVISQIQIMVLCDLPFVLSHLPSLAMNPLHVKFLGFKEFSFEFIKNLFLHHPKESVNYYNFEARSPANYYKFK
jgi:hypothetical protein